MPHLVQRVSPGSLVQPPWQSPQLLSFMRKPSRHLEHSLCLSARRAVGRLAAVHALLAPLGVLAFVPAAEALAHAVLGRGCSHRLGDELHQVAGAALLAPTPVAHLAVLAVHALAVQAGRAQVCGTRSA